MLPLLPGEEAPALDSWGKAFLSVISFCPPDMYIQIQCVHAIDFSCS